MSNSQTTMYYFIKTANALTNDVINERIIVINKTWLISLGKNKYYHAREK